jgi:hypothetical protein
MVGPCRIQEADLQTADAFISCGGLGAIPEHEAIPAGPFNHADLAFTLLPNFWLF